MIGLPSFQSDVTVVPIRYLLICGGLVIAFQTLSAVASILMVVSAIRLFSILYCFMQKVFAEWQQAIPFSVGGRQKWCLCQLLKLKLALPVVHTRRPLGKFEKNFSQQ